MARETKTKTVSAFKTLTAAKVPAKNSSVAKPKAVKPVKKTAPKHLDAASVKKSSATKTSKKASKKFDVEPLPKSQEEMKFILKPQRDKLGAHEKARLPERYHDNRVVLMVRDPWWLFCYWDFSNDYIINVVDKIPENQRSGLSRSIRVYRNDTSDYFDIPVNDAARSWYVNANVPECAYFVELGLKTQGGAFFALSRSNTIKAPYYGISDKVDEEWMTMDDATYARILGLSGGIGGGKNGVDAGVSAFGSDSFQEELKKRLQSLVSSHGLSSASLQFGLSSGELRAGMSSAQLGMSSEQFQMGMSSAQFAGSSETMQKFGPEVFNEYTSAGFSSAQFMGSSEQLSSGALAGGKDRKRKFWLEVYTDVVVYGRTEPDAAVTFCNKSIKLNPDGTFRFYFTMPIGDYDFPVTAVSADEVDTITIEPMVTRRTRHNKPYRIETEGFEKKSV